MTALQQNTALVDESMNSISVGRELQKPKLHGRVPRRSPACSLPQTMMGMQQTRGRMYSGQVRPHFFLFMQVYCSSSLNYNQWNIKQITLIWNISSFKLTFCYQGWFTSRKMDMCCNPFGLFLPEATRGHCRQKKTPRINHCSSKSIQTRWVIKIAIDSFSVDFYTWSD